MPKQQPGSPAFVYDGDGCIEPSGAELTHIQIMAAQPANPYITAEVVGAGKGAADPAPLAEAYRRGVAQRYGLTIFDGRKWANKLAADDANGELSYQAYLEAAQKFMAQFGVTIEMAGSDMPLAYGGRPLTAAELKEPGVKATLLNIMDAFSNVPSQYVELGGLRRIILDAGMAPNGVAAYADVSGRHDTVVFDAPLGISPHTVGHELGHLLEVRFCGPNGMYIDNRFAAIDGDNATLYSGTTFDPTIENLTDYLTQAAGVYGAEDRLMEAGDPAAACRLVQADERNAAGVAAYSQYHPNLAEAEAELYGALMTPGAYVDMLDPRYPVLREQFTFLLARLGTVSPGLAAYFLAVGRRPANDGLINCIPVDHGSGSGLEPSAADQHASHLQR